MAIARILLTASLVVSPAALFAQQSVAPVAPVAPVTTQPIVPVTHNPKDATGKSIATRKNNQQDRIANGIKDGQLTPSETSKLEGQEAAINKEESAMRAQDNGKLTKSDKETLTKQQNVESHRIHHDRHNTPHRVK